jgi:hypothetical protein
MNAGITNPVGTRVGTWLRDLIAFLSQEVSIHDIAARIGRIVRDPGIPLPIELASTLPDVASAHLSRYPDSGLPSVLTLELISTLRITAAELVPILGAFRPLRTDIGQRKELIFYPPHRGPRWEVAVIAEYVPTGKGAQHERIAAFGLRRDPIIEAAEA